MSAKESYHLVGRCGLYCGACDIYLVHTQQRRAAQEKLAKYFKCDAARVRCEGCRKPSPDNWCHDCKIAKCLDRNVYTCCSECSNIDKCSIYQNLNRRYRSMPENNLQRIKTVGERVWLREQDATWSCPKCGVAHDYEAKRCPSCGEPIVKKTS